MAESSKVARLKKKQGDDKPGEGKCDYPPCRGWDRKHPIQECLHQDLKLFRAARQTFNGTLGGLAIP